MTCDEIRAKLSALIDNELSDSERAQVDAHLDACSACTSERDALLSLRQSMQAWREPKLNPFVSSRIEEALWRHAEERRALPVFKRTSLSIAGLGAVAALILVFVLGGRHRQMQSSESTIPIAKSNPSHESSKNLVRPFDFAHGLRRKPNRLDEKSAPPSRDYVQQLQTPPRSIFPQPVIHKKRSKSVAIARRLPHQRRPTRIHEREFHGPLPDTDAETMLIASTVLTETANEPAKSERQSSTTAERDLLNMVMETD